MEKVVGADKGAEVPVIEPNKSGEVSAAKKEDFYTKMQNKMIDLRKQSNIYLNHAPKSEKYGLCQRIRNLEDEIFGLLIEARKRYWNKTSLTKLDVAHEQLRGYWRLFYELGYFDYRRGEKEPVTVSEDGVRRFKVINFMINEIGPMINGLIEAEKRKAKVKAAKEQTAVKEQAQEKADV